MAFGRLGRRTALRRRTTMALARGSIRSLALSVAFNRGRMTHPHVLRTLGRVSLTAADGVDVPLREPGLVALLVLLATAGDSGVSDDELLLRLTPSATAGAGRAEVARLASELRARLGSEGAIVRRAGRYALGAGVVTLDVRISSDESRMGSNGSV